MIGVSLKCIVQKGHTVLFATTRYYFMASFNQLSVMWCVLTRLASENNP